MSLEDSQVHDVLIVGAGPCGLALAARLFENTPSALFTDSEHQRYHWMKASASSRRTSRSIRPSRRSHTDHDRLLRGPSLPDHDINIAVLDNSGEDWMTSWNNKFKDLHISHLRSPMFFHPDPRDRDGLLGFTHSQGRESELKEISGVIGKELSKHQRKKASKQGLKSHQETTYLDERNRPDYFRPSQSLFKAYCEDITQRYNLGSLVQHCQVNSISYSPLDHFTVETSIGIKRARIVVLAIGAGAKPSLPPDCPFQQDGSISHVFASPPRSSIRNSAHPSLPPHVLRKIRAHKSTNILVVGGGLTSAQITTLCSSAGVTKVWHLMRGPLKTKHFDFDLGWVGKYKNHYMSTFWSADSDEERAEIMKEARNGGSITLEYKKILESLVSKGKVELRPYSVVTEAHWDASQQTWEVKTEPVIEGLPRFDHVIYATGVPADINRVEPVRSMMKNFPIETVAGMPCLTHDLMWNADTPLFVTGRLAGLRLGPAGANLEGARQGAERVAWKIGELLRSSQRRDSGYISEDEEEVDLRRLGLGVENQFGVLDLSDTQ